MCHAVRARWDPRGVWHTRYGSKALRGLLVGDGDAVLDILAWEILVFPVAGLEGAVLGVVGCVVGAADAVEDMFAEFGGVGSGGIACFEAEGITTDEAERWREGRKGGRNIVSLGGGKGGGDKETHLCHSITCWN